jgi:hypothetical protein
VRDTVQAEHISSQSHLLGLFNSLGHGAQSVCLVVAFGTNLCCLAAVQSHPAPVSVLQTAANYFYHNRMSLWCNATMCPDLYQAEQFALQYQYLLQYIAINIRD